MASDFAADLLKLLELALQLLPGLLLIVELPLQLRDVGPAGHGADLSGRRLHLGDAIG